MVEEIECSTGWPIKPRIIGWRPRRRGVGEVMRDDDHRSMVRCETAQRPEDFPVRFELEVHICKARMADLSEECDALTRILARCASLARRAQRCNGPSADAVRQFADCRQSEISKVVQPELDKIRALLEGHPGLAFRLGGVVRPNDRGDFRHLIAPQSSRVSASRSGGRLPRAAGALRPRVSPGRRQASLPPASQTESSPRSGRSWYGAGRPPPPRGAGAAVVQP